MTNKRYRQIRAVIAFFVSATVSLSVTQESYLLAVAGVVTGMLFMLLVRSKTHIVIDEREQSLREKAAQLTYSIFTPTIGVGSFLLILFGQNSLYLFTLGQVLAYLTLFLIAVYSFSFAFLNRKYGGTSNEE